MSPYRQPSTHAAATSRCTLPWCTTSHGGTIHPDDEVHRSTGVAFDARVRRPADRGPGRATTLEVGVLRRPDDDAPWVVIDDGRDAAVALSIDAARALRRLIHTDPSLRSALDATPDDPASSP